MKLKLKFTFFWLLLTAASLPLRANAGPGTAPKATSEKFTVYVFLSETCPISQFYTLTLKELYQEFSGEAVQFTGIFPNASSSPETVAEFKTRYALPFKLQPDPEQKLTKSLQASITPEVIVKNNATGAILYKGRIDDSYFRVGKRRTVSREHDLKNALTALKNHQPVSKPEAPAVGCYITFLP